MNTIQEGDSHRRKRSCVKPHMVTKEERPHSSTMSNSSGLVELVTKEQHGQLAHIPQEGGQGRVPPHSQGQPFQIFILKHT